MPSQVFAHLVATTQRFPPQTHAIWAVQALGEQLVVNHRSASFAGTVSQSGQVQAAAKWIGHARVGQVADLNSKEESRED